MTVFSRTDIAIEMAREIARHVDAGSSSDEIAATKALSSANALVVSFTAVSEFAQQQHAAVDNAHQPDARDGRPC